MSKAPAPQTTARDLSRERIAALEAELAEAQEEIRQLRALVLQQDGWRAPLELDLTATQEAILAALVTGGLRSKETLHAATRGPGREVETEIKIVDVQICHIRRKLKPYGLVITTVWGRGYELQAESRERLLNWAGRAAA